MNQYWYIVKDQQHFGPYSLAELKHLQLQQKLEKNTVLWHPKWPAPQLYFEEKLTPPPFSRVVPQVAVPQKAIQSNYRRLNSLASLTRIQQHQKSYEDMATISLPEFSPMEKFKPWHDPRVSMAVALFFSALLIFNIINQTPVPNRPESMAPSQYQQMQDFWQTQQTAGADDNNTQFFTILSKDYKTLWLGQKNTMILESVSLMGENKKILSKTDFAKTWDQQPAEKLLSLSFENHELPPMGFYHLKITWVESPPWSFEATQKSQIIDIKIGTQNDDQLKNMITKFHEAPILEMKNSIAVDSSETELKEKYQTLSSLISDLKRNWDDIKDLNHPKMVKAMNSFQKDYAKSTGSFLTAFVLSNEKEIKSLSQGKKTVNTSLIAHLHNLTENAKKTGVLSAELMSNYIHYAKNPKKNELWAKKISSLEKDLLDKMGQL